MDREILFRGKRIDNGEWVEGYVIIYPSGKTEIHKRCTEPPDILLVCEVNPETVCQYTGLADKNGRKIFEGDIIQYNKKLFRIVWVQRCTHFTAYPIERLSWSPCMNIGTVKEAEVVGNIFDNPELLEAQNESDTGDGDAGELPALPSAKRK